MSFFNDFTRMNTIRISSHDVIDVSSWTRAASSQPIRNNQSRLGHTRFPALQTCNVYLLYALIGSSWYISSLRLVIIITLFTLIGHCKNALFVWSQHLLQPFAWLLKSDLWTCFIGSSSEETTEKASVSLREW